MVTTPPSLRSLEASGGEVPREMTKMRQHEKNDGEEELVLDEYGDLSALLPLLMKKNEDDLQATVLSVDDHDKNAIATSAEAEDEKIVLDAHKANIAIRVVLERYDLASIRDHVTKVRNLFRGNAPYIASLAGGDGAEEEGTSDDKEKTDEEAAAIEKPPSNDAVAAVALDHVSATPCRAFESTRSLLL